MFTTYHHRLIDRWGPGVASFAMLADDSPGWRPSDYRVDVLGCVHVFRFPTSKLLDHEHCLAELKQDPNPFALVTAAHLSALRTRHDTARRFELQARAGAPALHPGAGHASG